MGKKGLLIFTAATTLLTLAGILLLDRPLAEFIRASGWEDAWLFSAGTVLLDTLSGKGLYKLMPGLAFAIVGAVMMFPARIRRQGAALLFVGVTHMLSTMICGMSKDLFNRMRPYELLNSGNWDQAWFVAGNSFPSGHAGFYFGLFLPLAYLFPRRRWPLLAVPFFIAAARLNAGMHFLSDVTASMTVAALLTLAMAAVLRPAAREVPHG
jgi:membrane-associated phospholipid phosphatase